MLDGIGYQAAGKPAREEKVVATKRRRNSITRLIEDVVDDAKDLVDDVVDRAKDVERDGRKAVRRAVKDRDGDDGNRNGSARENEMDDLKSALDDLTAKVNRLVAMQAEARKGGS
jgi:polyhydroxyalkanoate synthesis regulator phasin